MAVLKGAEFKRCLSPVADVPEPMSSRVAALGPVELFDFEKMKETQVHQLLESHGSVDARLGTLNEGQTAG